MATFRAGNRASFLLLGCSLASCGRPAATPATPGTALSPLPSTSAGSVPVPSEARPSLRLPTDVRPTAQALELVIAPEKDGFAGRVDIDVDLRQPRQSIWLHARGLHVTSASVTPDGAGPVPASWVDEDEHGLGRLALAAAVPPGHARIHMEYDASFVAGTKGLFRTKQNGSTYAFTQFEAIDARRAFPCFDEPSFKIPFSTTLVVPSRDQAIANAPEVDRAAASDSMTRIRFAQTRPLPSYLVAFAVGPLDVVKAADIPPNEVRKRPIPLRGVAAKGRGPELAYALAHAGEILSRLESYFGIEYPYEKMDILAVPDFGGAMENAGAVTFAQDLLLLDPKTAPFRQKQNYAMVVAHEFAHQWFGDLVTMAWWDDTWLNESFAEWMGYKIADLFDPSLNTDLEFAAAMQGAIGTDSLVSARQIHQPIATTDDIENSFDDATYEKGGSVIAMFERWLGPDVFKEGVRRHLAQHAFGNATVDDFLGALSAAAHRDVSTPYRSFLDQPGVPYIEAAVQCSGGAARVHLKQTRFLPLGSTGSSERTWQVPVCLKYSAGGTVRESCTLLAETEGDVALEGKTCPSWVFPNAHGVGYYRFGLASGDLAKVRAKAVPALDTREKMAFGDSLRASFSHGTAPFAEVLDAAATLANDPDRHVATEPSTLVSMAYDWLWSDPVRPKVEAFARKLMAGQVARLGWARRDHEPDTTMALRAQVLSFVADVGKDPQVRAEAKRRAAQYIGLGKDGAIHRDAVDENLAHATMFIAGQDADAPFFDAMLAAFSQSQDDEIRSALLSGLSAPKDPALSARVLGLVLDDRLKFSEMLDPLWGQMSQPTTREASWAWLKEHWDAVAARASGAMFSGTQLLFLPSMFCDEGHGSDAAAFLTDRASKIEGGPRVLAKTLEAIRLCTAKRRSAQDDARRFFSTR